MVVGPYSSLEIKKQRYDSLFPNPNRSRNPSSVTDGRRGMTSLPLGLISRDHPPLAEAKLTSKERVEKRGRGWKKYNNISGLGELTPSTFQGPVRTLASLRPPRR